MNIEKVPEAILEEMRQRLRQMLEHYGDDLSDDTDLMEEALTTIENILGNRSYDEVMHHSRDMAIPYLALMMAKEKLSKSE